MNEIKTQDAIDLLKRCQQDPLFFSRYVLGGEQPWDKQKDIMLSVRDNPRTVVPSGFGVGKTWAAARCRFLTICFFITYNSLLFPVVFLETRLGTVI